MGVFRAWSPVATNQSATESSRNRGRSAKSTQYFDYGSGNDYESSDNDPYDMSGEIDQAASEVFNDTPFDNHIFVDLEGGETELKDSALIDTFIEETLMRRADLVTGVKESIALFDAEARGRYVAGQCSGDRISVNDYMRGSFNCFKKRIGQQRQKDLAVSLLIDNSGSMSGDKSVIATQSLVLLGQVMHELEIPWEAHSFTDGCFDGERGDYSGYAKLSYVLKRFDQTWDSAKKWFGVANSSLLSAYTRLPSVFSSNYDEVNLHHIYEKFKLCGHRDRLMIVMSDGATCGSTETLKTEVERILQEGTLVLGLGICNRNVEGIYPHHVTFTTMDDLQKLPEFFADMIVKLKKGDL